MVCAEDSGGHLGRGDQRLCQALSPRCPVPSAAQWTRREGKSVARTGPRAKCHAEWRSLNSSILTLALSFVSSTDWLIFSRLSAAFSETASLCDSWICFAASFALPQVSLTAPLA